MHFTAVDFLTEQLCTAAHSADQELPLSDYVDLSPAKLLKTQVIQPSAKPVERGMVQL
jgi:hypothetical protein